MTWFQSNIRLLLRVQLDSLKMGKYLYVDIGTSQRPVLRDSATSRRNLFPSTGHWPLHIAVQEFTVTATAFFYYVVVGVQLILAIIRGGQSIMSSISFDNVV